MPEPRAIVVVGAGGHAKVIIDCLRLGGWNVVGCTDADPTPRQCVGVAVIGGDDRLADLRREGVAHAFCALGDNAARERLGKCLLSMGFEVPAVIGPGAIVSPSAQVGPGAVILPGAIVSVESAIGAFAIVNTNASVDHDGMIGTAAHIGPGSALAGEVNVGDRSFVGTGSIVIPKITIGADTVVGAGAVVVRDIPAGVIAYGNPATVKGSGGTGPE